MGETMTEPQAHWETLIHMLALAARLEGEGQYNLAKLLRAGSDALTRRAAYQRDLSSKLAELSSEVEQAASALARRDVGPGLAAALRRGKKALDEGRLPLIHETPHPYVCRTCGHTVFGEPGDKCPTCGAWPATFQQFMPIYWLNALEPFAALDRLRQTPKDVAALVEELPEDILIRQPGPDSWSIRHVVSHLRDAQGVLSARLKLMLEQNNPSLTSQAVFEWATRDETRSLTTHEVFDDYRATREDVIATLENLPLKDWWRTGQHEEFGVVTLRQQVSYFAAHESTHLPQIEALRQQFVGTA